MGSPLSGTLAELYLQYLEKNHLIRGISNNFNFGS